MSRVLFRVLVARFYKLNTGFFLLFFVVFFALLDGHSTILLHHAIMQGITSSYGFMAAAMAVWAAYNFKCISYCLKELHQPENSFLLRLQCVDNRAQYYLLLSCQAALFLPLLVYAAITAIVGFREHHYVLSITFLAYQLLMCLIAVRICFGQINGTWRKPAITLPSINIGARKNLLFYLIHYSLSERKGTFIGIKLFSLLLLQAMVAANTHKLSKEAICVLIMFLISAHSLLPMHYVRFVEGRLAFLRNMPISIWRRLLMYVVTYTIIFLPELLFLLLNEHHIMPLPLTLSLYAVAVSQLSLYTALQYLKGMGSDKYTGFVFALFFANLLLLASTDLWVLFAAEAVIAVAIFVSSYYSFEFVRSSDQ